MNKIIKKEVLAPAIKRIKIEAKNIARRGRAGQFVVVIPDEKGERIPLTLAEWDANSGTIDLIFQEMGTSTKKLGALNPDDNIYGLLGPLGKATEIENYGTVLCIGGGVGIAEVLPVSRALKEAGNKIIAVIGARSKNLIILEEEMKETCNQLYVTTDDGSAGTRGFVTDILTRIIESKKHIDLVYTIGPLVMMQAVSKVTKPVKIKTLVSLNPIMVDATGMCGSCRVTVAGKSYFACVDGPDFDAHQVDFNELNARLNLFKEQEECSAKNCPSKIQKNA